MAFTKGEKILKIFVDLDGVLADWEGRVYNIFGKDHKSVKSHILWQFIGESENFWLNIEKISNFDVIWEYVKDKSPTILTGCPKSSFTKSQDQKIEWCKINLGPDVDVITCLAKDKQKHITEPGDILIDDNIDNCSRWIEHGGVAIHHDNDNPEKTIELLNKILSK